MCDDDCDWSHFIICCCEILCVCCINCNDNDDTPKYTVQQTTIYNQSPGGTYVAQQPLNQGEYPYSPSQQQYPPQPYGAQQYPSQQYGGGPQQYSPQQYPSAPSLGTNPSAPFPGSNIASNQAMGGSTNTNYSSPPPTYSEAVGVEVHKTESLGTLDIKTTKA